MLVSLRAADSIKIFIQCKKSEWIHEKLSSLSLKKDIILYIISNVFLYRINKGAVQYIQVLFL